MNNLHEILEICLQDIEQGADIDTVLFRYPELAHELRPILEASVNARSMAIPAPSAEVVRRNRVKVLQRAAQLRAAKTRSSKRVWFTSLRRAAVTLAVVATLFVSGTRLVGAASTTVPGDNLYPVKRTWEDVLVLFTFNMQQREALEVEHENERLHELRELFAEGRFAEVEFAGQVTSQNGNIWIVSGIPVIISNQTEIRDQGIVINSAVRVKGHAQGDGVVLAERVRLLSSDEKLPDLDDEHEDDKEDHEGEDRQEQDNSGKGSGDEKLSDETQTPEPESESKDDSSNSGSGSDNSDSGSDDDSDSGKDDSDNSNDDDGREDNKDDSGHDSNDSSDDSGGGDSSSDGEDD
ncbi:MAG: hypothetical protein EHM40_13555 [Chloroflexi bacterium]|nr:MAG: hypothetical protein EHM40_13555 [Chloroflexota bacterium]